MRPNILRFVQKVTDSQGSEAIVSKIQRIPRPRQLFPELAAILIEWKRTNLRATRTLQKAIGQVPVWVTGSLAGVLGIMLAISLFFMPEPTQLQAAASVPVVTSPVQILPPVHVDPQPTPAFPVSQARADLLVRFMGTTFPFDWEEERSFTRVSSVPTPVFANLMRDLWQRGQYRNPPVNQFVSYLTKAVGFPSVWPKLAASNLASIPLSSPSLRSMGLVVEKPGNLQGTPDEALTYQIILRNTSQSVIENLAVHERVSSLARVQDVVPQAGISGDELVWNLESLAPGASRTFLITLVPESIGQIDTFTRVFPTSRVGAVVRVQPVEEILPIMPKEEPQPVIQTPPGAPDLKLTYTEVKPLKQGDTLSMIFEVKNVGTASASDVILFVRLSGQFEHRYGEFVKHQIGTLQPGQARRALLQATARDPGEGHLDASLTMQGAEKESRALWIPIESGNVSPGSRLQPVVHRPIMDQVHLDQTRSLTVLEK